MGRLARRCPATAAAAWTIPEKRKKAGIVKPRPAHDGSAVQIPTHSASPPAIISSSPNETSMIRTPMAGT